MPSAQLGELCRAADKSKDDEVKSSKRARRTNTRSQYNVDLWSASVVASQVDTTTVASPTGAAQGEDMAAIASPIAAAAQVVPDKASVEEGS